MNRQTAVMVYGAYGNMGKMIVNALREAGVSTILGGRDQIALSALAEQTRLMSRCFEIEQADKHLDNIGVLINCAGPFASTARTLALAALAKSCHYLDIGNEPAGLEAIYELDAEARSRQCVLLPGVGFGTTASNCLLHRLMALTDDVESATIVLMPEVRRRGDATRRTMLQGIRQGCCELRHGRWVPLSGWRATQPRRSKCGKFTQVAAPLGDGSAAYRSTGLEAIRACIGIQMPAWLAGTIFELGHGLMSVDSIYRRLNRARPDQASLPPPPDKAYSRVWVCIKNRDGREYEACMDSGEGCDFTTAAVFRAALSVIDTPAVDPGALTPAMAFGANWLESLPNTVVHLYPS